VVGIVLIAVVLQFEQTILTVLAVEVFEASPSKEHSFLGWCRNWGKQDAPCFFS